MKGQKGSQFYYHLSDEEFSPGDELTPPAARGTTSENFEGSARYTPDVFMFHPDVMKHHRFGHDYEDDNFEPDSKSDPIRVFGHNIYEVTPNAPVQRDTEWDWDKDNLEEQPPFTGVPEHYASYHSFRTQSATVNRKVGRLIDPQEIEDY